MTRGKESGQVILLVAVVTAILLLLSVSAVTVASTGLRSTDQQRDQIQAYYVAEAGVEQVLAKIRGDQAWFEALPLDSEQVVLSQKPYAGGKIEQVAFKKILAGTGRKVEITSKGSFGVAHKTLKINLLISTAGDLLRGLTILPDSPVDLGITGNFGLEGNGGPVILNGSLSLGGSSEINADVYASSTINGNINGTKYQNYPDIPSFPEIDMGWYKAEAQRAGQYYTSNTTFGGRSGVDIYNGAYFVEGNITISGEYRGKAIIVATGNIELPSNNKKLVAESSDDLLILMAPNGYVDIENAHDQGNKEGGVDALIVTKLFMAKGDATLHGCVLAQQAELCGSGPGSGTVNIICQPNWVYNNLSLLGGISPRMKITSWSEEYPVL